MVAERQPVVIDALGVDQAEAEIAEMIVVGDGDGEAQARHSFPPPLIPTRIQH